MVFWCENNMALIPIPRQIRRRIVVECKRDVSGMPKLSAEARVDSRNRRVVVPGDTGNPWNGEPVSQPTFQALLNLTGGKKAAAGE